MTATATLYLWMTMLFSLQPVPEGKHLFILSGQSNMARLDPEVSFTPAVASEFGEENVIVVKYAVGGTPIRRWYRDWKPPAGDVPQANPNLYDTLMARVNASIEHETIATVTFIWMQGERDAGEELGEVYEKSLTGLYRQVCSDLARDDVNFVIGRLSDFDLESKKYPHWSMIREIQVKVAGSDRHFAWIDTDDLNDGVRGSRQIENDLHMSDEGYVTMGKRFAGRSIQLIRERLSTAVQALLPEPREVTYRKNSACRPDGLEIIYLYSEAGEYDRFAAGLLQKEMQKLYSAAPEMKQVHSYIDLQGPAIVLGIPSRDRAFAAYCSKLPAPPDGNEQSYVLDIDQDRVIISGGGEAGLFYGVQTLVQLMEEARWREGLLEGMLIRDWPEMKERWVHYNYFFHLDRYEYIRESITTLAKYKVNGIVFEFEDRFRYRSHPTIAAPVSLTPDQVRELTLYARQYHIDIIPLVQGFGHAAYILKHEEYKHLREDPAIYQSFCPLNEETYELIFDLFTETIEATPGVPYFHIGGDEVRVMAQCPHCREKKKEIGELGLYLTWLNRVHDFMQEHGRTMVFWDDMPLKKAGIYETTYSDTPQEAFEPAWDAGSARLDSVVTLFPRDNIFMRWNYSLGRARGNIATLDWYRERGFDRMIATAVIGNWPLIPDYEQIPENIRSFTTLGAEKDVNGVLCTAWGDDAGNHFEVYWMGFLATAEFAWSSGSPEGVDAYWDKYIRRFFGPGTSGLKEAFHQLSARVEFWNTALLSPGNRGKHKDHDKFAELLIRLPHPEKVPGEGSWTQRFEPLMKKAREEKQLCREATRILEDNMNIIARNAYNLEVFVSMGRLMEAHCDLVLSIGEIAGYCDQVIETRESRQGDPLTETLNNMATTADDAWNRYVANFRELEKLWEEARYPKGEEGYVMNPQTNYLAGRTPDLSYLILAEKEMDLPGYARELRRMADLD